MTVAILDFADLKFEVNMYPVKLVHRRHRRVLQHAGRGSLSRTK
jgi:hypothetical protein